MKIWEVHALHSNAPVRTTGEGHCEIDGLLLSEKAYLLAIRDMRPASLFKLVEELGPENAASELINYYRKPEPGQPGHSLLAGRSRLGDTLLVRNDEARLPAREYAT